MKTCAGCLIFLFLISFPARGESLRALIDGFYVISLDSREERTVPLSYVSSSVISMQGDTRFFRGIQLELNAPPNYPAFRDSLGVALYGNLDRMPGPGVADLECRRLCLEPLPAKIQTIYQIPLRADHGLRTTPYATLLTGVVDHSSFPLLFRLMPVIKGISEEVEKMVFHLSVKPILSNEGAVRIAFRYPESLPGRPLIVLIDDELIENPGEERLLKEGEHNLVVLSADYRNQSSRFMVERAKVLELSIELRDTTPLMIFEYPENSRIFVDNVFIPNPGVPLPVEAGLHEVRFVIGNYTIIRTLAVQKGKTYRVALSVDMNITESD